MQLGSVVQSSPGLEYVQELSRGSFGALWLARLAAGPETGRLVVARRLKIDSLDATRTEKILTAARLYGGISHPSLVKLLGVDRTQTELVWVEEQVIGVPLGKLYELMQSQQTSIPIDIATKLTLDAVRASIALRRACRDQNLPVPEQAIFPDSFMVANFGEAMLAGFGVTNELARCAAVRRHQDLADVLDPVVPMVPNNECREIFTAGATLWKLLVIRSLFDDYGNQQTLELILHSKALKPEYDERLKLCVPNPIAQIIRQATERDLKVRFQSLQDLATAFESLPPQCLAAETKVREWLSDIAGDYLSDIQRSSGVRRVPFSLRMPVVPSELGRPSFIPTPLPGFHEPFVPKPPSDTIPSIAAPNAPETRQDTLPSQDTVSNVASTLSKRRLLARVKFVAFVLIAGVSAGYAFLYRGQVQTLAAQAFRRATSTRTQPKGIAPKIASVAAAPQAAERAQPNRLSKESSDGAPAQTQTLGSASEDTNPDNSGTRSTNHSKRRGPFVKPGAPQTPPPSADGRNRWGI